MFICKDNLEYIKTLDEDTIDLIYFDPPFAITEADYDKNLNWKELWTEMWRVLKIKGTIIIHSSQPFTFDLVASQRKYFKYCWYWNKGFKTGHLFSKKQPMRLLEEICVFYKKNTYYPQTTIKDKPTTTSNTCGNYFSRNQNKTYTNNLNYPVHLLEFKRRNHKYSTRPVELCEYIVRTYSKENELILDLTCSDGQCAKACSNTNRNYIGVDHNPNMIADAIKNLESVV
tara:strand:+ start:140 stop:826 length:687 start_codon:yes stop_codon:yes gene_type:complete